MKKDLANIQASIRAQLQNKAKKRMTKHFGDDIIFVNCN